MQAELADVLTEVRLQLIGFDYLFEDFLNFFILWSVLLFSLQHIVDAVLAIRKEGESIDLHMVEVMEMQHKTAMDTT